jgi:hypothetical protein
MRRALCCCLVFGLPALLAAENESSGGFPDRTRAFSGVPFGASLEEARQRWQLEEVEGAAVPGDPVAVYLREEESHVLGGVVAREVVFYFVNGFTRSDFPRRTAVKRPFCARRWSWATARRRTPATPGVRWSGRVRR